MGEIFSTTPERTSDEITSPRHEETQFEIERQVKMRKTVPIRETIVSMILLCRKLRLQTGVVSTSLKTTDESKTFRVIPSAPTTADDESGLHGYTKRKHSKRFHN